MVNGISSKCDNRHNSMRSQTGYHLELMSSYNSLVFTLVNALVMSFFSLSAVPSLYTNFNICFPPTRHLAKKKKKDAKQLVAPVHTISPVYFEPSPIRAPPIGTPVKLLPIRL